MKDSLQQKPTSDSSAKKSIDELLEERGILDVTKETSGLTSITSFHKPK